MVNLATSPWPMPMHDRRHSNRGTFPARTDMNMRWNNVVMPGGASMMWGVTIAQNGTIWINTTYGPVHIDTDGTKIWHKNTNGWGGVGGPIALDNGLVVVPGGTGKHLRAWDNAHNVIWDVTPDTAYSCGACNIDAAGNIIVQPVRRYLVSYTPAGVQNWKRDVDPAANQWGGLAINEATGRIYLVSQNTKLWCRYSDGTADWEFTTAGAPWLSAYNPVIAADGTLYVACGSGKIQAVHPDGTHYWTITKGTGNTAIGGILSDGTIIAFSSEPKMYALHPDGTDFWDKTVNQLYQGMVIDSLDHIIVGDKTSPYPLVAYDSAGGILGVLATTPGGEGSGAIALDGTVLMHALGRQWAEGTSAPPGGGGGPRSRTMRHGGAYRAVFG